jgi:hypothetical protein
VLLELATTLTSIFISPSTTSVARASSWSIEKLRRIVLLMVATEEAELNGAAEESEVSGRELILMNKDILSWFLC